MKPLVIVLHKVSEDGLPDMHDSSNDMTGRVAFIWDGNIVSGWPIKDMVDTLGRALWEPAEDRFGGPVAGVEYWLELPTPAWSLHKM